MTKKEKAELLEKLAAISTYPDPVILIDILKQIVEALPTAK